MLLYTPPHHVNALAFAPDGRTLFTGDDRGVVRAWDRLADKASYVAKAVLGKRWTVIRGLKVSPDGRWLVIGSDRTPEYPGCGLHVGQVGPLPGPSGEDGLARRGVGGELQAPLFVAPGWSMQTLTGLYHSKDWRR